MSDKSAADGPKSAKKLEALFQKLPSVNKTESGAPVEPLSVPPPSSILDQLGADFPPEPLSAITSRLSESIGEWRLPTNLVNGADEHRGQLALLSAEPHVSALHKCIFDSRKVLKKNISKAFPLLVIKKKNERKRIKASRPFIVLK